MKKRKHVDESDTADVSTEQSAEVTEATILAGGDIVGTTADDDLLVEGPNSK